MLAGRPTEWVSFTDEEQVSWLFDLSFLRSGWRCTFGTTCQGTEPDDHGARGCCAHGAHVVDDRERDRILDWAQALSPTVWKNYGRVGLTTDPAGDGELPGLFELVDEDLATRRVDDACVFLNDRDFSGGHGCALHIAAVQRGERPIDNKPTVCWQLPFRVEYHEDEVGTQTVTIRAWRRSDWGAGGAAFGWWCTEDLPPVSDGPPTWFVHLDELRELTGDWVVERLVDYLEQTNVTLPEQPVPFPGC